MLIAEIRRALSLQLLLWAVRVRPKRDNSDLEFVAGVAVVAARDGARALSSMRDKAQKPGV